MSSTSNADLGTFTNTGGSESDSDSEVKLLSPCQFSSPENARCARRLSAEENEKRLYEVIDKAFGDKAPSSGVAGGVANYPLFGSAVSSLIKRPLGSAVSSLIKRPQMREPEERSAFATAFRSVPRSFRNGGTEVVKAVVSPPEVEHGTELDEGFDYVDCPVVDVPDSPVTPKGLTKKQKERTNALNALVSDWRSCEGNLPSVRGFEPFTCKCIDKKTQAKAKMAVKATMRGELVIRRKKGGEKKGYFGPIAEEYGGKLRSFVCTSWGMKLDRFDKPVYFVKPGRVAGAKRCYPIQIDVGTFDRDNKLVSFHLNPPVMHFWMTPEGKTVGQTKEGGEKKVRKKRKVEEEAKEAAL